MAVVEALKMAWCGWRGGGWHRGVLCGAAGACAEAVAEEELFVLAVQVEDLEESGAGFLDDLRAGGIGARGRAGRGGGAGGVSGFDGGKAFVEAREEGAFFLEEGRVGDSLVLFQEAIFLEGELVELVTEVLMMTEGFRWRHERGR